MSDEPAWLVEARSHVGLSEIPGPKHNNVVLGWLKQLGAWWSDDETPWCATFVAHCMRSAGLPLPKHWYRAKDWMNWGFRADSPCLGCVVVFERKGGGHVAIAVAETEDTISCVGGNQGNEVSVATFDKKRVLGYRWPIGVSVALAAPLPYGSGDDSTSEA